MKSKRIAFVTSTEYPHLTDDDQVAARALASEGVNVVPAIWNDPAVMWRNFDAVIVRSCWDYHMHQAAFRRWVESVHQFPVWNPPAILLWNMDKHYLRDLAREGVAIPRTAIVQQGSEFDPAVVSRTLGTNEVVIKPAVSASAWKTSRCSLSERVDEAVKLVDELRAYSDVLIQEFMPEIETEGEWSLIFFGKKFSHAVRKYPRGGDFRVQKELGGRYRVVHDTPPDLIRQAQTVLELVKEPLLYARVDGIERDKKLLIIELELIEPQLFFDVWPLGAKAFGERLREVLGKSTSTS